MSSEKLTKKYDRWTVKNLLTYGQRTWLNYDQPYKFNIVVQTMDEINNPPKPQKDHKYCATQSRYAF